jgi:hypothetical protein
MADTYVDSSIQTGMNDADFNIQKDTLGRLDAVINKPAITMADAFPARTGPSLQEELPKVGSYLDALHSDDYRIFNLGQNYLNNKLSQDAGTRLGVGQSIDVPFTDPSNPGKFIDKKYGYDYRNDNEDFYYRNDYLKENAFLRNSVYNPLRFLGRVAGGTLAKVGESLGYMGSMITSIGSENYMENVADNGFSRWFEKQEQAFKDHAIPVYKQAGFDEKGFFSKLTDWTFWNDSVADVVAFMASAIAQSYLTGGVANLTQIGRVGSIGINAASRLGKFGKGIDFAVKTLTGADDLGGIGNWAFNTASEAAFEMKGVYNEAKDLLLKDRGDGKNNYSDETINKMASQRAASDFKGNLLAFALSNAFENRFIFQPIKKALSGANVPRFGNVQAEVAGLDDLTDGLKATEKTFNYSTKVGKFTDWKNPAGRLQFYGKRAVESAFMEGLYEENAQLAIERLATSGAYEDKNIPEAILATTQKSIQQAKDAFAGTDQEAAESIGLGALIGIGGTAIVAKAIGGGRDNPMFTGERRASINEARSQMEHYNELRKDFLSLRDIYKVKEDGTPETDDEGNLVYDEEKINARADGLKEFTDKQAAADAIMDPIFRQQAQDNVLADFVHAATKAGIIDTVQRHIANVENKSPEEIEALGFNPAETIDVNQFRSTFDSIVNAHEEAYATSTIQPKGVKTPEFTQGEEMRKYYLFKSKAFQISAQNAFDEVNRVVTEGQLQAQPSPYAPNPNSDPTVRQYNSVVIQQNKLQQFAELSKDNGDFYNDYIEKRAAELESEQKALSEILAPKLQDGTIKESRGLYVSRSTKANKIAEDLDLTNVTKHAGLKNSLEQWKYTTDKLSSSTKGYDNYIGFSNYRASIKANDVVDDTTPPPTDNSEAPPTDKKPEAKPTPTETTVPPTPEQEKEAVTVQQQPTPAEDVEEVSNVDNDTQIIGDPSYIDPTNSLSYMTPLKTTTKESVASTENEETLVDDSYNQVVSLFIKGISTYAANKKAFIVNDKEDWVGRFPEQQREEAKANLGQVIIFEGDGGTLKVGDIASFAANPKFKPFLALPIVMSFTKGDDTYKGFNAGIETRALIKAGKMGTTVGQVLTEYATEKQRLTDVRNFLSTNRNDKVPVVVEQSTEGIYPRTKSAPVIDRFGEAFTVKVSTLTNGLHQYKPGTIVADFGKSGSIPVTTKKVFATPVATSLKELYNFRYTTEEQANKVRDYMKNLVYTNTTKFFKVQEYTDSNGTYYMINFLDKDRQDINDRKGSMDNMLAQNLNVNNKILTGKKALLQWAIEDKKLTSTPIQPEQYTNFVKENLVTTIKKVSLNGNLHTDKVNPYFTFSIADPRFKQTTKSKTFDRFQKLIDANASLYQESKDRMIETVNYEKSLTKDEKFSLIKQIEAKPTIVETTPQEDTLSEEKAASLFGTDGGDEVKPMAPPEVVKEQEAATIDEMKKVEGEPVFVPNEDLSNLFGNFGEEDDSFMSNLANNDMPLSNAEQQNNTEKDC